MKKRTIIQIIASLCLVAGLLMFQNNFTYYIGVTFIFVSSLAFSEVIFMKHLEESHNSLKKK